MQSVIPGLSMPQQYGLISRGVPSTQGSELHHMGRPGVDDAMVSKVWHPDSPLFWIGALVAATVGLAAVSGSGSIKVGPVHAAASGGVGK